MNSLSAVQQHRLSLPYKGFTAAKLLALIAIIGIQVECPTVSYAQYNPFQTPFARTSIWNTPLYTTAQYAPTNLGLETSVTVIPDTEYIIYTDDTCPPVTCYYPGYPYRSSGTTPAYIGTIRVPNWFSVSDNNPNPGPGFSQPNNGCAFVYIGNDSSGGLGSGNVIEIAPVSRPDSSVAAIWGYPQRFGSLFGDGLGGGNGAHYGSGLSVLGGSIRGGELTSSAPIRHALHIELAGSNHYYYSSSSPTPGYRWPANRCDNYAADLSNEAHYQGTDPNLDPGTLLAIPPSIDVDSLGLSAAGAKLAHALQDYGAYVVDDSVLYGYYNFGVSQEATSEWNAIPQSDLVNLVKKLNAVTNNTATSIGGNTGTGWPRAPFGGQVIAGPTGQTIAIKAVATGKYASSNPNNSNNVQASFATSVQPWEQFQVVDAGNGQVAFYSPTTGYYVSCDLGDGGNLKAAFARSIDTWEKFWWYDLGNGNFALQAVNGFYVTGDLNDSAKLKASQAKSINTWEVFTNLSGSVTATSPNTPTNLTATAGASGSKSISLSWFLVDGAMSYKLYRATTSNGVYSLLASTTTQVHTYTNIRLTAGQTYYYKVTAVNSVGQSAKSSAVSATAL